MNSSLNILPVANNKESKQEMNESNEGMIKRLITIFKSSGEPILLEYKERFSLIKYLEEFLSMKKKGNLEDNTFLSNIKKNIALSFEQEEYKEREKLLFKKWAEEEQKNASKIYDKYGL